MTKSWKRRLWVTWFCKKKEKCLGAIISPISPSSCFLWGNKVVLVLDLIKIYIISSKLKRRKCLHSKGTTQFFFIYKNDSREDSTQLYLTTLIRHKDYIFFFIRINLILMSKHVELRVFTLVMYYYTSLQGKMYLFYYA